MSDQLECEIGSARTGEAVVVTVRGEVDLATAPELESCLQRAFGAAPDGVVLDLEGLTFIDSSGLRVLVALGEGRTLPRRVPDADERPASRANVFSISPGSRSGSTAGPTPAGLVTRRHSRRARASWRAHA